MWGRNVRIVALLVAVVLVGPLPSSRVGSASAAVGARPSAPRPSVTLPGPPFITDVAARGLGLLVSWVPADVVDAVSSYSLTASAVSVPGVTIPPGCEAPAPTTAPGGDSSAIVGGL